MSWFASAALFLEMGLLIYVAAIDLATRQIYNEVCLAVAVLGFSAQFLTQARLLEPLLTTAVVAALLLMAYHRHWLGGGDVKLLVALALGFTAMRMIHVLTATALAGGLLAAIHLCLRRLPDPKRAPKGASMLRRVYAVERWRNVRSAPLPYGAAIAGGVIWTLMTEGL